MGVGILMSFSHKGIFADLMDNKLSAALGKLSLDLFLCNLFWRNLIYKYLDGKGISYQKLMVLYLALVFGTALTVRLLSFIIHRCWPHVQAFCRKTFLAKET